MGTPANPVTSAKDALANANNFSKSAGDSGHMFAPKPKHEFSDASYGMAKKAKAAPSSSGSELADSLKAKSDNVKEYAASNQ